MKKAIIWDLDGTLLDSYDVIVESIYRTFLENDISCSKEEIHRHAIRFSINSLFSEYAERNSIDAQLLKQRYSQISSGMYLDIKVMNHGREALQALTDKGVENYVFTHRGKTTIPVLDNLELTPFFREIVTVRMVLSANRIRRDYIISWQNMIYTRRIPAMLATEAWIWSVRQMLESQVSYTCRRAASMYPARKNI